MSVTLRSLPDLIAEDASGSDRARRHLQHRTKPVQSKMTLVFRFVRVTPESC